MESYTKQHNKPHKPNSNSSSAMESYTQQHDKPHKPNSSEYKHQASSPTELMSSAQVLADAAMSTFRHEKGKKVEMSQAAVAADNLLHAASQYGHLEEKSFGKYIDTAEGYLHKYAAPQTNQSKPSKFNKNQENQEYQEEYSEEEEERPRPKPGRKVKKQQQQEEYEEEEERPVYHASGKVKKQEYEEEEEGGIGNYVKMAQGFMKSQDGGHSGNSAGEGGVGEYMKLAQGFLGKR